MLGRRDGNRGPRILALTLLRDHLTVSQACKIHFKPLGSLDRYSVIEFLDRQGLRKCADVKKVIKPLSCELFCDRSQISGDALRSRTLIHCSYSLKMDIQG